MTKSGDAAAAVAARRLANEVWIKKQDTERNDARDKLRRTEDAKTARLKALRLAKEATDRISEATINLRPSRRCRASP